MPKLRIFVAEDHETVREGLMMLINSQTDMEVVGEASDGVTAIDRVELLKPDVVVMDISLPRLNGLRATGTLKQHWPEVRVLTLTRHAADGYLHQVMHSGACGYVLKQSRASELFRGIRVVAGGGKYLDPGVSAHVLSGRAHYECGAPRTSSPLSAREEEAVRLIARGYSNKEIAARLALSVKTVETHKTNAMRKLGMASRIDLVRFAHLQGWLENL
jgi:DNA-binding NarL/FixJ family response regulator